MKDIGQAEKDFSSNPNGDSGNSHTITWDSSKNPVVSRTDVKTQLPQLTLREFPDEYLVFFWASSTSFNLEAPPSTSGREYRRAAIATVKNSLGEKVGIAELMHPQHWDSKENSGLSEFVFIGRRSVPEIPGDIPKVLALQIKWEDGVAYRIHIAEIEEEAWWNSGPTWKLVALG